MTSAQLQFTKMHGLGNDFVVIHSLQQDICLSAPQISWLADRHTGIGFDQLLVLTPPPNDAVDFGYQIFNQDGTEAAHCGNGARCLAKYIQHHQLSPKTNFRVATRTHLVSLYLKDDGTVRVDIPDPDFDPAALPFISTPPTCQQQHLLTLPSYDQPVAVQCVSLGNPHIIIDVEDLATAPVETVGAFLQKHPAFPDQVNVGFRKIQSRAQINLRVFERGAGETQACGTGACAAVVTGITAQMLDHTVDVQMKGGALTVNWASPQPVYLDGPAQIVFEGSIAIPSL